ncbi:MAG: ribonuclease HII [Candidatus Diapherotrites archaeon]|nr:ribonuclease HII [Candidatus Diapherotrites archaeon]
MVIAGVVDTEKSSVSYREMGCKDSKLLTPARREELAAKIRNAAKEIAVIEISAHEIDSMRKVMSLNEVEAKKIAELIMGLKEKPDKIIIDCPDTEPTRFIQRLRKYLGPDFDAIAEHKADVNYPIVSAASIIAKVARDEWVKKTRAKYGEIGSGYPADPVTKEFLKSYFEEHGKLPPFARKSWDTSKRMEEEKLQARLGEFE